MGAESQPLLKPVQTPTRAKRRKIALACTHCRARKTRCDGGQPACSTCDSRGAAAYCFYEQGTLKTQRYVSALEARLQDYQQRESRRSAQVSNDSPISGVIFPLEKPSPKGSAMSLQQHDMSSINQDSHMHGSDNSYISPNSKTSITHHKSIVTDAMVIIPSPSDDDISLSGEPSSIAFVQSMLRSAGKSHLPKFSIRPQDGSSPDKLDTSDGSQRSADLDWGFLPPRPIADKFVHSFWEYIHPILPILHKPTFMTSYRTLWGSEDCHASAGGYGGRDDPIFLSTINIAFAIGSQLWDQVEVSQRYSIANNFYKRSKSYYSDEFLDTPSLSVVQLLLLTGVYLQSTQYANRCWNVIGSAVRVAQSINLHIGRTSETKPQLQREMERRVWHVCVFLDRQLAVTFGRPTVTSGKLDVPLPQMVDDEYLLETAEGCQPSNIHSQMSPFIYSSKLFNILCEILDTFYFGDKAIMRRPDVRSWSKQSLQSILQFNNSLDEFLASLPQYLVLDSQTGSPKYQTDDRVSLGAKVLYLRFLYIRIILLRPILQMVTQVYANSSNTAETLYSNNTLEHSLALKTCSLCISTVQILVAQIHSHMEASYWTSISHKIHYAFSCVIVLVAARLCPATSEINTDTQQFQAAWSQCIGIFENYKSHFSSASHVIDILEMLEERLQEPKTRGETVTSKPADPIRPLLNSTGSTLSTDWAILDDLLEHEPMGPLVPFYDSDLWSQYTTGGFSWEDSL